jgi:hypothetical protein
MQGKPIRSVIAKASVRLDDQSRENQRNRQLADQHANQKNGSEWNEFIGTPDQERDGIVDVLG